MKYSPCGFRLADCLWAVELGGTLAFNETEIISCLQEILKARTVLFYYINIPLVSKSDTINTRLKAASSTQNE